MSCTRPNRLINMVLLVVLLLSLLIEVTIGSSTSLWLSILGNPYLQRAIAMAIIGNFCYKLCRRNAKQLHPPFWGIFLLIDLWEILLIIACNSC